MNTGQFQKGQPSWNKGLKGYNSNVARTPEWCWNIAQGIKRHHDETGRKSTENDLLRRSTQFKEWRLVVFKRDNYTCQLCGANKRADKKIRLHPHHIKSFAEYPELRFVVENGLTLCELCHGRVHNVDFNGYHRKITCAICGRKFSPKYGNYAAKTCSRKCGYEYRRRQGSSKKGRHYPHLQRARIANCPVCGKEFRAVKDTWRRHQKYCSRECYLKARWNYTGKKAELDV